MATDLDIQVTKPRTAKSSVYRCNAACDSTGGVEDYYRINVFNPMLEQVTADLSHRFADHQRQSLLLTHLMLHSAPKVTALVLARSPPMGDRLVVAVGLMGSEDPADSAF